jgi:hypothetical protein
MTRMCVTLAYADWLRRPEPRPALKIVAQDYARLDPGQLDDRAVLLISVVAGLADALARPGAPISPEMAQRWVHRIHMALLDCMT